MGVLLCMDAMRLIEKTLRLSLRLAGESCGCSWYILAGTIMLDSALKILDSYISGVTRYEIEDIKISRGENPEDLYYLCILENAAYVVFETDYVDDLGYVASEANEIFGNTHIQVKQWVVRKDHIETYGPAIGLSGENNVKDVINAIVVKGVDGSHLKYAVLLAEHADAKVDRYHPTNYGHVS